MATCDPGTLAETAALDAYIKLMRAAEAITARVGGVMAAAGLTMGQFGVLEARLHRDRCASETSARSCCAATGTRRSWWRISSGAAW